MIVAPHAAHQRRTPAAPPTNLLLCCRHFARANATMIRLACVAGVQSYATLRPPQFERMKERERERDLCHTTSITPTLTCHTISTHAALLHTACNDPQGRAQPHDPSTAPCEGAAACARGHFLQHTSERTFLDVTTTPLTPGALAARAGRHGISCHAQQQAAPCRCRMWLAPENTCTARAAALCLPFNKCSYLQIVYCTPATGLLDGWSRSCA